jgi:uncharacterized protein
MKMQQWTVGILLFDTAGFHMALHAVERLLGEQMAQAVAKGIDMEGL